MLLGEKENLNLIEYERVCCQKQMTAAVVHDPALFEFLSPGSIKKCAHKVSYVSGCSLLSVLLTFAVFYGACCYYHLDVIFTVLLITCLLLFTVYHGAIGSSVGGSALRISLRVSTYRDAEAGLHYSERLRYSTIGKTPRNASDGMRWD